MKKVLIGVCIMFFMVLGLGISIAPEKAGAVTSPIASIVWGDSAMGGWAFGDTTRSVEITLNDASDYDPLTTSTVGWYWDPSGSHTDADSVTQNGNTYTATFNLTGTTTKAGVLNINVTDAVTHQPIAITAQGATDASMFMAHNLNIKSNSPFEGCASTARADETTDFSTVTDFRSVDLTLHCPARGKIHFTSRKDLTASSTMEGLRTIGQSLDADKNGEFGLSDSTMALLKDAGAELTIYDLPYTGTPDVKYNGGDSSSMASNISYDLTNRSLTLSAAHFSTYSAVPKVTLTAPENNSTTTADRLTVKGSVNDPAATVKVYVNDSDQGTVSVDTNGVFEKEVVLGSGSNTIKVTSSNSVGNGFDVTRTVTKSATLPATGVATYLAVVAIAAIALGAYFVLSSKKSTSN